MKNIFTVILFTISVSCFAQQEQMYTQFMYNKLSLNPAYAGVEDHLCLTALYRDQWNGFPGAPVAQAASVNLPRIWDDMGVGFAFERQSIGISKYLTFSGIYAYTFGLADGVLSMGINISARNYTQDYTDSRLFAVQGIDPDPSLDAVKYTKNLINAGFGLYYKANNFYVGGAVPRLAKNDIDFDDNDVISEEVRHLYLMGGITFDINEKLTLQPQIFLKKASNAPVDLDINFGLTLDKKYTAALTYRLGGGTEDIGESIDLILGFQLSDQLLIGIAQDFTLSGIRTVDNGSLEAVVQYCFGRKTNPTIKNPRFF